MHACMHACVTHKVLLTVVALLGLFEQLVRLVQLGVHQLLLQLLVLHHLVYVLGGRRRPRLPREHIQKHRRLLAHC